MLKSVASLCSSLELLNHNKSEYDISRYKLLVITNASLRKECAEMINDSLYNFTKIRLYDISNDIIFADGRDVIERTAGINLLSYIKYYNVTISNETELELCTRILSRIGDSHILPVTFGRWNA